MAPSAISEGPSLDAPATIQPKRSRRPPNPHHDNRREWRAIWLSHIQTDMKTYVSLLSSRTEEASVILLRHLRSLFALHPDRLPPSPDHEHLSWAIRSLTDPSLRPPPTPQPLLEALTIRKRLGQDRRSTKKEINRSMFRSPRPADRFSHTTLLLYVEALPKGQAYPPPGFWIAEDEEIYNTWAPYLATAKLPDPRRKRSKTFLLDCNRLQHIIPAEVSCVICDKDTKKAVFSMRREFCSVKEVVDWGKDLVCDTVTTRKNIRKGDTGIIVQVGMSAGSLSVPKFGWVKNVLSKKTDEAASNRQLSAFFTYFWLRCKRVFSEEITRDLEDFYREWNLPRLQADWPAKSNERGILELPQSCGGFKWDDVELAPGCGVMVQRYSRAVHREHQGHEWAINWTTLRDGTKPMGGNFILAQYGILIKQSANCAFAWKPVQYHCTTLALYDPKVDAPSYNHASYNQQGAAFVTSGRIRKVYKDWEAKQIASHQKVSGAIAALENALAASGDETYGDSDSDAD